MAGLLLCSCALFLFRIYPPLQTFSRLHLTTCKSKPTASTEHNPKHPRHELLLNTIPHHAYYQQAQRRHVPVYRSTPEPSRLDVHAHSCNHASVKTSVCNCQDQQQAFLAIPESEMERQVAKIEDWLRPAREELWRGRDRESDGMTSIP
ncbi:hypothetical protein BU25DRAFT_154984 [Macroventuria anomochaeta]|uniref:Uncharacterized protein n=1 Tax=Macroventuria anomochaeta TaxID=301207 RepID=A0ACB6RRV1_9PLEO|nr:uncharacterized protein BU25DRAFT_154984 [Macroventuria anomochaeta]KAF2624528.1 hypothetical protein BU25DRAFT_154984 [Macroventuria anomochaeta]